MSADFRIVQWTPFKRLYDLALIAGVVAFAGVYAAASLASAPAGHAMTPIQLVIRTTGAAAFALLTLILAIGPLARLWRGALPLLYNRRHLGVTCFLLALTHFALTLLWYHGFSDQNPLISILVSNPRYGSIQGFPFESLGLAALLVLFVMAATSHDFWNSVLGPGLWKALHMAVYAAYVLVVGHVMLGAVMADHGVLYPTVVGACAIGVAALHIAAGAKEARSDRGAAPEADGWLRVGAGADIPDGGARIVGAPSGERIAVFRDGARVFALSNVCRHQGGPLGEGRIVDGCVTCPWHGFQYLPSGRSPAPYSETVATYRTQIVDGVVFVDPAPAPLGAETAPSMLEAGRG